MADDDYRTLERLEQRVRAIEDRNIKADGLHEQLLASDGGTAEAVRDLARIINDPRTGLIVELANFRAEVVADRKTIKAYIAGASLVLSAVLVIVNLFAPAIRAALHIP